MGSHPLINPGSTVQRIGATSVFEGGNHSKEPPVDLKILHAKIGELTLENDFLEGALTKAGLLSEKR